MAFRCRSPCLLILALLALLSCLAAPAVGKQTNQLTVFWGRNKDEGTLREACDTGLYTTVIISFYSVFGHGRYWSDISGHPLSGVGADIKHCQSKGIPVLLSIGGDAGSDNYSLPTFASADVADNLWNAHLGGSRAGVFRPFGDAVLDGVDFYVDRGAPDHYDELARRLDGYNRFYRDKKGVRLTAMPRCGYPDPRLDSALRTGLFERIHVRFYGDDGCAYAKGGTWGVVRQWEKWTARYPTPRCTSASPRPRAACRRAPRDPSPSTSSTSTTTCCPRCRRRLTMAGSWSGTGTPTRRQGTAASSRAGRDPEDPH